MKAFGAVGLAIAGVLLAGTALAQGPGGGMGPGPGMGPRAGFGEHRPPMERAFGAPGNHGRWWNNPKVVERLKLTDEQRKTFDGILLDHRAKLIDLRASLEKAELTLEPLMSDDPPNEAKILAQIDKVAQARAELEKANAGFLLAIRAKLTPEQWKQVQAFRANHERAAMGREERGPRHGGQRPGEWKQSGQHHQAHPPAPPAAEPQSPASPVTAPGAGAEQ